MAGNAFCLHDDLERAREIYPDSMVIAVNGASREVKAFALCSQHPERFVEGGFEWIRHQNRLFGSDFTVHSTRFEPDMPWVGHWWKRAHGGGGSAWCARKIAAFMGFDPIILCGCPLVIGCYAGYRPGGFMTRENIVADLRRGIEGEPEWHEGVVSMSGWTREFLGSC